MFNNFSMSLDQIKYKNRFLLIFERSLIITSNTMNYILLFFGVLSYFIYLYTHSCQSLFHHIYLYLRFFIVFSRIFVYFTMTIFFLGFNSEFELNIWRGIISLILTFLEVNDFKWCFDLKEIISEIDRKEMKIERHSNKQTILDETI